MSEEWLGARGSATSVAATTVSRGQGRPAWVALFLDQKQYRTGPKDRTTCAWMRDLGEMRHADESNGRSNCRCQTRESPKISVVIVVCIG
eukprot:4189517-Pleurochrysis_carterae.AAC.2